MNFSKFGEMLGAFNKEIKKFIELIARVTKLDILKNNNQNSGCC